MVNKKADGLIILNILAKGEKSKNINALYSPEKPPEVTEWTEWIDKTFTDSITKAEMLATNLKLGLPPEGK
jgi:hypothetical protein